MSEHQESYSSYPTPRQQVSQQITQALKTLYSSGYLSGDIPHVDITPSKHDDHGDFACPIALALARTARKKPREIAEHLQKALGDGGGLLLKTEIAGPGYLNMFVAPAVWHKTLRHIVKEGGDYIRSQVGAGERILIEFVSANPTGPLHVAHGRGAVTGDLLANVLSAAGYNVEREYYVNDLGKQVDVMAESIFLRYGELLGRSFTPPEEFYPGEYVIGIAQEIIAKDGNKFLAAQREEWLPYFCNIGVTLMLARIERDLAGFGVKFDRFISERELTDKIGLPALVKGLEESGFVYEKEGKKWFKSTDFGDDKDRVVVRDDGRTTYFTSDIGYHNDKLKRGFSKLINVWGADHGGYVSRVKAGINALGWDGDPLEVVLVQMVSLSREGTAVKMGKRLGTAIWLDEVVAEVGRDALRYFFAMRRTEAQMDFDITLATKKSVDNPVFYAQMGHARMCSIGVRAKEAGIADPDPSTVDLSPLLLAAELSLIKQLARAKEVVELAAKGREPHLICYYIQELISQFHSYYTQYKNTERVISDDVEKTAARLLLCRGIRTVLKSLLELLGVSAPEQMYFDDIDSNSGDEPALKSEQKEDIAP